MSWGELGEDIATVDRLVAFVSRLPMVRAELDQDAADIRNRLDDLGVCVADPETVRAGLAFVHVLVERVHEHAWAGGVLGVDAVVCAVRNGLVAAVLDHLPAEARHG